MSKQAISHFTAKEESFMKRALELATRGMGKTAPNPMVGAVLVKNNKIIGEGYHHKAGEAHAEILALAHVNKKHLWDATLYVTLEPCFHTQKRTPPCADFLIRSGLKAIVIAVEDPNPLVNGKGVKALKDAGLMVRIGLLANKAKKLNEGFFKAMTTPLPFVTLKFAQTLDGKIATSTGESEWITNEKSRKYVHQLRSFHDAVLTSSKTVLKDNPHLGVRMIKGKDPLRIIIDRTLSTSPKALVYRDKNVMVVTTDRVSPKKNAQFKKAGIDLKIYSRNFKLASLLKDLRKQGVTSILIEAGGTLAAAFMQERLIDKYLFFIAPKIIGASGIDVVADLGINKLKNVIQLHDITFRTFDEDILFEAYPKN